MSKENNAEDNGGNLHQLILLQQQQQQQQEKFSLLASSLGNTLNTFGNSFKQYLETMIGNTSRSPVSEDPDLGNRQSMLSEDLKGNRLAKGNAHFESSSSPDAKNTNNTRTNEPEEPKDGDRLRLRIKRKFRDSDNVNSSTNSTTSCSTKMCRHISSSEDTENDDVNDDDRLNMKVKHIEYANPPLQDPLQTLNKVITMGNAEQPQQQQQIAQVQTVEEDVSELFTNIVEDKELGPPLSSNLSQAMQNVWQTNKVTEKSKRYMRGQRHLKIAVF